jgi:hypothetical protein
MSTLDARCRAVRDAVSARIDDEETGLDDEVVRGHLARCEPCARFEAAALETGRRVRVTGAAEVPDLTAPILGAGAAIFKVGKAEFAHIAVARETPGLWSTRCDRVTTVGRHAFWGQLSSREGQAPCPRSTS